MDEVEHAVSCFNDGFSCSQAVLSAYGGRFGLNHEMALKVSGAFGGGMGHLGETCGAVTGAFMLIGLKYGKTRVEDEPGREKAHSLVKGFAREFKSRNGLITCRELLGCDISTSEGMKLAEEKELFITRCPKFGVFGISRCDAKTTSHIGYLHNSSHFGFEEFITNLVYFWQF